LGNLFLGFPVARAKIADMISTSAPPALHHAQHENGGSDEIDATGLTGAGGSGGGVGSFHNLSTLFESLTGYNITGTGSATTTLSAFVVSLNTGATAGSTARLSKAVTPTIEFINFDRNCAVMFASQLVSEGSKTGSLYLRATNFGYNKHVGFKVVDGILYGTAGDGSNETTATLQTISGTSYDVKRALRAVFTAGSKCDYYVDSVLLGTITTGLPTGIGDSSYLLYCSAVNTGVAEIKKIWLTSYNAQYAT